MNMNFVVDENQFLGNLRFLRNRFYEWQNELDLARRVMLALGFACLTGLLAQVKFFLPGNPIPITGQVFAVLVAGVVLGGRFGALSQGLYVGLGLVGVPWLAGVTGMLLSCLAYSGVLLVGGGEGFQNVVSAVLLVHIPVVFIEGFVTGTIAVSLKRLRPKIFETVSLAGIKRCSHG